MIKKLVIENLNNAVNIFYSAIKKMKANKIDQWDENYPTIDVLRKDILEESAFGFFVKGELIAYIALNNEYDTKCIFYSRWWWCR